jgi:outer membrane receptor protein involved in Fe transport
MKLSRIFLGVLFSAAVAFAQSEVAGASLNGTVTDPSGAAVPNAKVTVNNAATGLTRTTETSEAGLYSFARLPVGTYDLAVEANGFKAVKGTGIALSVGAVATYDVHLEVGAAQETVSVTAEANLVESTRSQTSSVVNARAVADLPINGRNFLDFTGLTPGVTRDPTRSGDLSFGGQRGTANSLLVDGADSNNVFFGQTTGRSGTGRNPYSFSQDAVPEFQVTGSTYNADIGRAGGGVINVITKSGTNDLHGTIFEFFRDKALNANSWENNRNRLPKRAYHFNQFGGNIGGPIVKNKAFFFFDYDGQRNTTPNTVFLQVAPPPDALSQQAFQSLQKYLGAYSNGLNNDVYLGKVDWDVTNSQRITVRYNANRFVGQNFENSGVASAQEHTGNSNVTTDNIAGSHTWVVNPRAVVESRFVFTRDNEPGFANSTSPEAVIRQSGTSVLSIGRNSFSPRYTNGKTYQWIESLSYVRGRHSYKIGLDMNFQRIANFFPGNFSGSYVFNSYADFASGNPFSFTQGFAGPNTNGPLSEPNVSEYAFYAQDSWRISDKLTLNYGLRYDLFSYAQPLVKNNDSGLAALGLDTSRINIDHNNFAPRLGFAYRLDSAGKTMIRGGYGIYYGRTPSILTGTAITQNGIQVQTFTIFSNFPTYPNIFTTPPAASRIPDIYVFAKDYVQPLTHQWSFNIERQLGRDYVVTLGYLGVRGEHLSRTRDINLLPALPIQGTLSDGTAVTYFRHPGRLNPSFGRISLFDSGADSIYHGGFIQFAKRFSQNFQVQTAYTFAKVIDDAPDQTSVVVGTDDAKNAQDTLLPNLERGRGNADIRHRFVISAVWDLNYAKSLQNRAARAVLGGYQFSLITTAQSGRPFNDTVSSDVNNDGNTRTDRVPAAGRNTINGPNFAQVDFRFSRDLALYRERVKLRLIFEGFNVTNRANYNNILTNQYNFNATTRVFSPAAGFLSPTTTFDPRILQLAAKITF